MMIKKLIWYSIYVKKEKIEEIPNIINKYQEKIISLRHINILQVIGN